MIIFSFIKQETIKKIIETEEMKLEISIRICHLIFIFISFVSLEQEITSTLSMSLIVNGWFPDFLKVRNDLRILSKK